MAPKTGSEGRELTLEERFEDLKNENEVLRNLVSQQERELKDTQDFIFSMQPRTNRLTESDALADFNSLYESIEELVHTQLEDLIKIPLVVGKGSAQPSQAARLLLSLIPPPGREAFRYKNSDKFNIIATIMRLLCDWLLDRDFYCSFEKGGVEFLHTIESAMRNQNPPRDHIFCRTWHAETYLALTNRPSFQAFSNKLRDTLVFDLNHILGIFAPHLNEEVLSASILTSIVNPAIALAHKLHLSVDKYSFQWTAYHKASWEERHTVTLDLSQFECIDLIIAGRTVKFPTQGRLFTYILDLCPGLVLETCQSQSFKEPTILKQPRVLVAVTKTETGFYQPTLPMEGKPCTFLGLLEEKALASSRLVK